MAITLELDVYLAEKILRSDIVANLQYDGIQAVINWYDSIGVDYDFDQSLFWVWHRYDSALAAVMDRDPNEVDSIVSDLKEENPDEKISQEDVEEKCLSYLNKNTSVIELDDGSVIVNTDC
ncbi:MAG: hypothetical protein IKB70_06485 [Bacilli bacterium]|nr:hypothetical protein [Bacilli bacterium]